MKDNLMPKETATRLWKQGKIPDAFYTAHYMTPSEARDYYHNKIKKQAQEQDQVLDQLEKALAPTIESLLEKLK